MTEFGNYRLYYSVIGIDGFGNAAMTHNFRAYPVDNHGIPISGTDRWLDCMGNRQTKYVDFTVPSRHESLKFIVESEGPCRVQFSDFRLEPRERRKIVARVLLDAPFCYRNGVFCTNYNRTITGRLEVDFGAVASATLELADRQGRALFSHSYSASDELSFSVPAPEKPGESSLLAMQAVDRDGKVLASEDMEIAYHPSNPVEVTFRDDGVTLVNGKPFFQIGHWWSTSRGDLGDDMDFLREAGFNCILMPSSRQIRFPGQEKVSDFNGLDLAQEHGLLAAVEIPHFLKGETEEERARRRRDFVETIDKYRAHPALFAYFGPDEPMWGGQQLEPMKEMYELVRRNDAYHPLWYNEAPCGTVEALKEYAEGTCDTYGVDIYPVGGPHGCLVNDRSLRAVGLHTDRCMEAVCHRKPVWMILQGFAWAHILSGHNVLAPEEIEDLEYPTYEQSRFMAYNAILHGATGIQYHYLGYTLKLPDSFWKDLRQVTLELEYLSPVYTSRTVESPLVCPTEGIRFIVKNHNGMNYYLVTNENEFATKAEFSGCPEKRLNVLFGDAVNAEDGAFMLEMPAFGVAVLSAAEFKSGEVLFKPESYRPYSAPIKDDVRYK